MLLKTTKAYVELYLETFTVLHASILKARIGVYLSERRTCMGAHLTYFLK